MKVRIDLNQEGSLEAAIAKLERIAKDEMESFAKEIVEELAKTGADIARINFANAEYAGDHSEDVSFKISENGKTATVYADGNAVLFIEFGTGIYKQSPVNEYGEIISGEVSPHGEYGHRRGSQPWGWFYKGSQGSNPPSDTEPANGKPGVIHTHGNDADSSMYRARLELERRYESIVRSIWKRRDSG